MAKVSMINREKRRTKLVGKYVKKRAALKAIIADPEVGFEEKQEAMFSLQKFQPGAPAQPLPDHRSSTRFLPQVWTVT